MTPSFQSKTGDEEDEDEDEEVEDEVRSEDEDDEDEESSFDESVHSPLGRKAEKTKIDHPEPVIGLRDEDMTIDEMDADDTMTVDSEEEQSDEDEDEGEEETSVQTSNVDDVTSEDSNDDEEDWMPPPKQSESKTAEEKPFSKQATATKAKFKPTADVGSLQKKMDVLSLFTDEDKENVSDQVTSSKHTKDVQYDISLSDVSVPGSPPAKTKKRYV